MGFQAPTRVPTAFGPCRAGLCLAQAGADAQDLLIAKLRTSSLDQLPSVVAESMQKIDQRLFLRMAELADEARDEEEREVIARLASDVANTVQRLIQLADEKLQGDGAKAQALLRIAASETGEFEVPLPPERAAAVRAAIRERGASLDDGFVATVKAYMAKADADGECRPRTTGTGRARHRPSAKPPFLAMSAAHRSVATQLPHSRRTPLPCCLPIATLRCSGMDGLLQMLRELLQLYAAEKLMALVEPRLEAGSGLGSGMRAVLGAPPREWDTVLRATITGDEPVCGPVELQSALQDQMGEIVLSMPSGSALQALLAEYLNELLERTRASISEMA